jgi:hypothetical protein
MSDLPPGIPPELEEDFRKWERGYEAYLARWEAEMRKFLEESGLTQKQDIDGGSS